MMQYDRITLGRQAKELGFVRDTLEKVCRLADVLAFMEKDPLLSDSLALKGGTAINLTILDLPRQKEPLTVLSIDYLEIFGAKIVALLNRTAARDLYDIFNLQKYGLFDESEEPLLRKCVVFYSAIAAEKAPECFTFNHIMQLAPQRIKTDLIPVLRRGEHFDLELAQKKTMEYLKSFLLPENSRELEFWQSFNNQEYRPDLLFSDDEFLNRVKRHPMALWKCGGRGRAATF